MIAHLGGPSTAYRFRADTSTTWESSRHSGEHPSKANLQKLSTSGRRVGMAVSRSLLGMLAGWRR